jgi:chromate transport protein ChrA
MLTAAMALDYIKQSPGVQAALRGIRCGVLGMIAVAALVILYTTLPAWPGSLVDLVAYGRALAPTTAMFMAVLVVLVKYDLSLAWVIPSAASFLPELIRLGLVQATALTSSNG